MKNELDCYEVALWNMLTSLTSVKDHVEKHESDLKELHDKLKEAGIWIEKAISVQQKY